MKKVLLFLTIGILLIGTVAIADGNDFRSVKWGDNIEKVKAAEKAEFLDQANLDNGQIRLRYSSTVENYKASVVYIFEKDNKLANASYVFENSVSDDVEYMSMIKNFNNLLTEKYGKPINTDNGVLSNKITWKTPNTIITLNYYKPTDSFLNLAYIQYTPAQKVGQDL